MGEQVWGELIYYLDGYAYSILESGDTVMIGRESEIRAMIADPSKKANNPVVQDIVDKERLARVDRLLMAIAEKEAEQVRKQSASNKRRSKSKTVAPQQPSEQNTLA